MLAPDSKEFADRLLAYEQVFIDAVRATGGNNASRVLIVQTPKTEIDLAAKDSYDITRLKDNAKNRLMAEVHFYDPYIFTLMDKDADWGKVALYSKGYAPADDQGRTVNTIWYNNKNVDAYQHITNQVMKMKQKFVDLGYPVVIGEYGANRKDASLFGGNQEKHNESMMAWYGTVTAEMMKAGLIPYVWDINVQPLPHMTIFDRKKQIVETGKNRIIINARCFLQRRLHLGLHSSLSIRAHQDAEVVNAHLLHLIEFLAETLAVAALSF